MLVGLCAAGVVLALLPVIPVIRAIVRLRNHTQELRVSPILVSLQSLQLKGNRLGQIAQRAQFLVDRGSAAVVSMQSSVETMGSDEVRASLQRTGAEISALTDDLR